MLKHCALFLLAACALPAQQKVLIVADEFPAMEVLAARLKPDATCTIVAQTAMPADLASFGTVVVYIHRTIGEPAEKAFIEYTRAGGKLVLLHHSISSGKRRNRFWFPSFLEMVLPERDYAEGGYKWYEGIEMDLVNLAPDHYITTHGVKYPTAVAYKSAQRPAIRLQDTEVYLNHEFTGPRTTLMGIRFDDAKTGRHFEQDIGGWVKRSGKGAVIYLLAGHSVKEFEHPAYGQIAVNAVNYKP